VRLLIWQWGRRGAGPRFAMELADALRGVPGVTPVLSLSRQSELMRTGLATCELPVDTYRSLAGWAFRLATAPFAVPRLTRRLRALDLDAALCAMPGPLDVVMAAALRRAHVPYAVTVHDADLHPGDTLRLQAVFQRRLVRRAGALVALSEHVGRRLDEQGLVRDRPLLSAMLSPFAFGPPPPPPRSHGGKLRLLSFGRLLPYKGLDLLQGALAQLGPADLDVRVVGQGPESAVLDALRQTPGVQVENRWVPESELGSLLAWADALVLSHREASQSGVAAAALAAQRWIVATRVGGLVEQLRDEPLARLCAPDAAHLAEAIRSLLSDPPALPGEVVGGGKRGNAFAHSSINLAHQIAMAFDVPNGLA
jgi:glycosyltransferase involved in cell wall biosynthesis